MQIRPLDLSTPKKLTLLVYGPSGTGKTEFAATWPKPILYIDTDRGMQTIVSSPRIQQKDSIYTVVPETIKDIKSIVDGLKSSTTLTPSGQPFATLVLDTLTSISNMMMDNAHIITRRVGQQPTFTEWGIMIDALRYLIATGLEIPQHFLCLAHEQFIKDELSGRVWCVPYLTKKFSQEIGRFFDEYYHSTAKSIGGKPVYELETRGTGLVSAKSRLDLPSPLAPSYETIAKILSERHASERHASEKRPLVRMDEPTKERS